MQLVHYTSIFSNWVGIMFKHNVRTLKMMTAYYDCVLPRFNMRSQTKRMYSNAARDFHVNGVMKLGDPQSSNPMKTHVLCKRLELASLSEARVAN